MEHLDERAKETKALNDKSANLAFITLTETSKEKKRLKIPKKE